MNTPPIAILTDFGACDPFVGIMKGVIAGIVPDAPLIDLTHELPPGDIRQAAVALWQSAPYFPNSTIFLAVVDPGVGTERRPMLLQSSAGQPGKEYLFIGPDNGLFSFILAEGFQAWELVNPAYQLPRASMTFHGRDLFAPAAAHAARGVKGDQFGPPIPDPLRIPSPRLAFTESSSLEGEILYADRFGNYLTSLGIFLPQQGETLRFQPWLPGAYPGEFAIQRTHLVLPDGARLPLVHTFGQIPEGKTAALVGSSGLLEIAANRASAADILHLQEADRVTLQMAPDRG